jgi:RNA recognition motif-containing protein
MRLDDSSISSRPSPIPLRAVERPFHGSKGGSSASDDRTASWRIRARQGSGFLLGSFDVPHRAGARKEKIDISSKVFVGNLSFDVTRDELIEAFSTVGRVVDAKLPTDRETGRPRGFAFVEFEDDDTAQKCIAAMNGRDLKGRALRVNEAENRPPRPGGGGPGGPRPAYGQREGGGYRGGAPSSYIPPPPDFSGGGGFDDRRPPKRGSGSRRGLRRRKRGFD